MSDNIIEYTKLCERINNIITYKNLTLNTEIKTHPDSVTQFNFSFNSREGIVASQLVCYHTDGQILSGSSRNSYNNLVSTFVFNISWLHTHQSYLGQKLASLILIYGLCYLKKTYKTTKYAILDDDSDNNKSLDKNIYNKLGFTYRGFQSLESDKEIIMTGPEKQLNFDDNFLRNANNILNNLHGGKKLRKKYNTKI